MRWLDPRWPRILSRFEAAPVIIGGCGRSGTTLLASVLSCHPRFAVIGPETRAFAAGAYPADRPPRPAPFDLGALTPHLEAAPTRAARWCEKTPRNVHAFGRIAELFDGHVHLVHVVRDGRDVVCSFHPDDPRQPWISPERWVEDVRAGLSWAHLPQVHTVRYEDLVQRFEPTVRALAQALGEADPEPFLRYPEGATLVEHAAWTDRARPVDPSAVGRWARPGLRAHADALCRHPEAGPLLGACGYPPIGAGSANAPAPAPRTVMARPAAPWTDLLDSLPRPPLPRRAARGLVGALERGRRGRSARRLESALARIPSRPWQRSRVGQQRPPGVFLLAPPCSGADLLGGLLHGHSELFTLPADIRVLERVAAPAAVEAYGRLAAHLGLGPAVRWVDPSPEHLFRAESVKASLPGAQILVLRRPRAEVVASLAGRVGSAGLAEQRADAALAEAARVARWPQAMHVWEPDLRADPEAALRRIIRFLNLPWQDDLRETIERYEPYVTRLREAESP